VTAAAVPDEPIADGTLDLEATVALIRSSDRVLLRLASRAASASSKPYGPAPVHPELLHVERGQPAAKRLDAGSSATIGEVRVDTRELAWGAWGGTAYKKLVGEVVVDVDGEPRIAAVAFDADEERLRARLDRLADAIRELVSGEPKTQSAAAKLPAGSSAARFALVAEDDYLVLRDYENVGPRAGIMRYALLCAVLLVLAGLAWTAFARELAGAKNLSGLLGYAAVGFVLAAGALAMGEIARFASKYRATNAPLAWLYDDRVVVFPWVSRDGAIDTQPEGRLGAAIRIPEVDGVVVVEAGHASTVMLDTQHGPIDVFTTTDRALAAAYRAAFERALVSVAAPAKRPTGILKTAPSAA
jgi:hypothetical protein